MSRWQACVLLGCWLGALGLCLVPFQLSNTPRIMDRSKPVRHGLGPMEERNVFLGEPNRELLLPLHGTEIAIFPKNGEGSIEGRRWLADLRVEIVLNPLESETPAPPRRIPLSARLRVKEHGDWGKDEDNERILAYRGNALINMDIVIGQMPDEDDSLRSRTGTLIISAQVRYPYQVGIKTYDLKTVRYRDELKCRLINMADQQQLVADDLQWAKDQEQLDRENQDAASYHATVRTLCIGVAVFLALVGIGCLMFGGKTEPDPDDT